MVKKDFFSLHRKACFCCSFGGARRCLPLWYSCCVLPIPAVPWCLLPLPTAKKYLYGAARAASAVSDRIFHRALEKLLKRIPSKSFFNKINPLRGFVKCASRVKYACGVWNTCGREWIYFIQGIPIFLPMPLILRKRHNGLGDRVTETCEVCDREGFCGSSLFFIVHLKGATDLQQLVMIFEEMCWDILVPVLY